METLIRNLRIRTLKSQLEVCQFVCASLANELRAANLTPAEKTALADRWEKALKEVRGLQLAIDMLDHQETDARVAVI